MTNALQSSLTVTVAVAVPVVVYGPPRVVSGPVSPCVPGSTSWGAGRKR